MLRCSFTDKAGDNNSSPVGDDDASVKTNLPRECVVRMKVIDVKCIAREVTGACVRTHDVEAKAPNAKDKDDE